MAQKESQHRRELKKRIAKDRRARVIAEGGRELCLLLQPDATKALAEVMARNGETATAVISRLLIREKKD